MANTLDYSKLSDDTLDKLSNQQPIDYAKLSDNELEELSKLQAPAKVAPISAPAVLPPIQEGPGTLKSLAIGAAQGPTFEFGDEILSAIQAAGSDKPYEQILKENQDVIAQAKENSPIAYYGANIASGAAFNPLAKVVGAGAGAAMAPVAAATKSAPSIARIGQMGLEGAAYGAALGAGAAEGDQSRIDEALKGAEAGAVTGVALSGIADIGKKVLSPLGSRLKESNVFEGLKEQRDITKAGYDPSLRSTFSRVEQETQDEVRNLIAGVKGGVDKTSLPDIRNKLGKAMSDVREEAVANMPDFQVSINPDNMADVVNHFSAGETAGPQLDTGIRQFNKLMKSFGIMNNADEFIPASFAAPEAANIASQIERALQGDIPGYKISSPSVRQRLQQVQQALTDPIEGQIYASGQYPQYQEIKSAFKKVADTQDRLGTEAYYRGDVGALERDTAKILGRIKQLANENSMTGESFRRQTELLREAIESPGFKLLPQNVQEDLNKAVQRLDKFETLSQARGLSLESQSKAGADSKGLGYLMNSYRSLIIKATGAALEAPQIAKNISNEIITPEGTKFVGKAVGGIKNAANVDFYFNKLSQLAERSGNTQLAETLKKISQQDMQKRRAMTFVLMQQPAVRDLLKQEDDTPN